MPFSSADKHYQDITNGCRAGDNPYPQTLNFADFFCEFGPGARLDCCLIFQGSGSQSYMDHMSVLWCSHKWKPCYLDKIGGVFMHFSAKMR